MGIHWLWRAELSSLSWILVCLLMNLRLRCLNSRFWTSTSPQKCDLRCDCSEDLLDNRKKSLKCFTSLDVPFEKRAQTMVFYDNRDLSIVKFKKSEKYIREKLEISSVSSTETLQVILKVTDASGDVIQSRRLNHWFPWRHLPSGFFLFFIFFENKNKDLLFG